LKGERSGTFWPFWRLMEALGRKGRAPALVALENVCGALASHKGRDFARICAALAGADYRLGAMVVDAVSFVPQSRPRLFIVAAHESIFVPPILQANGPSPLWHPRMLTEAHAVLDKRTAEKWIWWSMPAPQGRRKTFAEIVEDEPKGVRWHTAAETDRLLVMMDDVNLLKVHKAQLARRRAVGAIYKRTRLNRNGGKVQRAEIRFDVAGCLRTPAGGSSRQTILMVEGSKVRSRLISPRETARLMGLPDGYKLPENYNEAYHLTGDGVVAPVVRHVASNILEPILFSAETMSAAAE
jgi:DNA (cytosine-5)-methyltransferase 1